eukprot:1098354-Pelagomonas_calceolata.AAC.6
MAWKGKDQKEMERRGKGCIAVPAHKGSLAGAKRVPDHGYHGFGPGSTAADVTRHVHDACLHTNDREHERVLSHRFHLHPFAWISELDEDKTKIVGSLDLPKKDA